MWSNQCVWEHGFVEFGDEYPYAVNFKRVGRLIYSLPYLHNFSICNILGDKLFLKFGVKFQR